MSQFGAREIGVAAPSMARLLSAVGRVPFSATILICFLPLLYLHFRQLWLYEHYQYFPLLLIAFPFVIARNRADKPEPRPSSRPSPWVLIIAGLVALAMAVVSWSPNLAALAFVITAGGILWHYYQSGHLQRFFPVWFVLLFLIKLPVNMDIDLIFWLQGITSEMASRLLDSIGINHVLVGHNIRIADAGFAVQEACSGIRSLFSLLAMTALILAFCRRSLVHSVFLLLAAVFWACLINVIRVATVVSTYEKLEVNLTLDRPHEMLGLILFAVAIGLMISTDRLLLFLSAGDAADDEEHEIELFRPVAVKGTSSEEINVPAADEQPASDDSPTDEPLEETTGLRRNLILGSFVFLGLAQLVIMILMSRGLQSVNPDDPRLVNLFAAKTLPPTINGWTRMEFSAETRSLTNYQGRNSAQWIYESELGKLVIAVDFPFLGWHELTGCYIAEGCKIDTRDIVESDNAVRATITAPSGANARLIFSEYTNKGKTLFPLGNDAGTFSYWRSRLQSSLFRQFASFQPDVGSFQIQLLYYYEQPPDEDVEQQLLDLHRLTARHIVTAIGEATQ